MAGKEPVRTDRAPAPFRGAPYSQAIRYGDLLFVSGQIGADPESGELVDGGIAEQTAQAVQNLEEILREAGSSLEQVLKTTIFLADFGDFPTMNEVYGERVGSVPPARSTVQVAGLPAGALVEIEAVAQL